MRIYRVVVRGQFSQLDDTTRVRLLDEADEHDYLRSAFTAEGTMTYDRQLVAFNFRYEVRTGDEGPDGDPDAIGQAAIERTSARLDELGIGHKRLRAEVTDMASIWS